MSARWTPSDRVGAVLVRWGIGRYDYRVEPGLYAMGHPDETSPVLVTAKSHDPSAATQRGQATRAPSENSLAFSP